MSFEQVFVIEKKDYIVLNNIYDNSFTEHRLTPITDWSNRVGSFISSNGTKLLDLTGSYFGGKVEIYNISTMEVIKSFTIENNVFHRTRCFFTEDEIILDGGDSFVRYTLDGNHLETVDTGAYSRFSSDLQYVANHCEKGLLKIIKIGEDYTFKIPLYECIGEFFTQCSSYFVYGTEHEIFFYDINSCKFDHSLQIKYMDSIYKAEGSTIIYITFSARGRAKLNFYDIKKQCVVKTLQLISHFIIHHIIPTLFPNEFYVIVNGNFGGSSAYLFVEKDEYLVIKNKCSIASTRLMFGLKLKVGSYTKPALR